MDVELLNKAVEEAKASRIAKGRTPERAAQRAQMDVDTALKYAADQPDKAFFFKTIGVSEETASRIAAAM